MKANFTLSHVRQRAKLERVKKDVNFTPRISDFILKKGVPTKDPRNLPSGKPNKEIKHAGITSETSPLILHLSQRKQRGETTMGLPAPTEGRLLPETGGPF